MSLPFRRAPAIRSPAFASVLASAIVCALVCAILRPAPARASLPQGGLPPGRASQPGPSVPASPAPLAAVAPVPGASASAGEGEQLRDEIRALARRGHFDSALALCRRILERDSGDTYARFMAGKLSPQGKASAEHFRRVLESGKPGPEAEESRFRLGQYHYAAGKYHLAIPRFREYLDRHPGGEWREPALYWMGRACLALAQSRPDRIAYLDSGLAYFQRLRDLGPPDGYYHALALEGMAKVRLAQGDRAGAWLAAEGALAKAPEDERASILLLAAQLRRDVDRDAERGLLRRLAEEHPRSPEVRHLRRLNGSADPARWRAPVPPGPARPPDSARTAAAPPSGVASELPPAAPSAPAVPAAAAAPAGSSAPAAATAGARYTLQLGAFAQAANAKSLMSELSKLGFAPELAEGSRGGKSIYQVRLGRFATAEAAQAYAREHLKPRKLLSQPVPLD